MRSRVLALSLLAFANVARADDAPPPPAASAPLPPPSLEGRIRDLEERLRAMEARSPPPAPPLPLAKPPTPPAPLDVREPPNGEFDFGWMNGNNPQPSSLLTTGPITWSIYVDTYYAWQFHNPVDQTIFPATTAPRHNEVSVNLAHLGLDLTGLDGPIGRLYIQYGSTVAAVAGQDTTSARGFFLANQVLEYVQQAAVGWHFHALHGVNLEAGIFPSYVGPESYLPEENWAYTHSFLADSTPYYFFGVRAQIFPTSRFKLELWLVNGWQTFGEWDGAKAGGYALNYRPYEWLSLANVFYAGQDVEGDPKSLRIYSDSNIQVRYFHSATNRALRSLAFSLVGDIGHEQRGNAPSGYMGGMTLTHRFDWTEQWKTTLRADFISDQTQAITPKFPVGSAYPWPDQGSLVAGGLSGTLDFWPSPWLVTRLEYSHRFANQPFFSGSGGITGPRGVAPTSAAQAATFVPDLRTTDDRVIANVTLRL